MRIALSRPEFDLCWERLALGEPPTILAIPSHGATREERAALLADAWDALEARGLAGRGALDPRLTGWLTLLSRPDREVDARLRLDSGPRVRAVAAAGRGRAVLAVLTAERLLLEGVGEDALAESVVGLLPPHPTPRSRSISLRAVDLERAAARAGRSAAGLESALREAGLPRQDAGKVAEVLGDVVRTGQFGVATRSARAGRRQRGPYAVTFYDTPEGRWQFTRRPDGAGQQWSTLSPADHRRLTHAVAELLSGAR
ncbi:MULTISPECIES: ESX secretion-associated protein EspG [Actinosynnema]|uniref:ESX secretion-associated protein EspG n=1 Tax=Actinosynnema TaxID=40566 RepID=UPI0020A611AE|nr:ESX secretion-associated protein EspG [Actinosynnema pretiosum]MCP2094359.1 EspG family protein [Actinosynnema pretiosum]